MLDQLQERNKEVSSGDLSVAEAMLIDIWEVARLALERVSPNLRPGLTRCSAGVFIVWW
jgi:hypothetical protein